MSVGEERNSISLPSPYGAFMRGSKEEGKRKRKRKGEAKGKGKRKRKRKRKGEEYLNSTVDVEINNSQLFCDLFIRVDKNEIGRTEGYLILNLQFNYF